MFLFNLKLPNISNGLLSWPTEMLNSTFDPFFFPDIQYGEDSTSTMVTGLYPNRTYNVSVAALLNTDVLLSPVGPVQITTRKLLHE